ncbi:MAG: tRNA (guanine-N1)-methyltransferase [Bacteroidetes bacterium]|nr:tRNA (guanine-N1)-methyltransferase [Bacteroidota bacterium]
MKKLILFSAILGFALSVFAQTENSLDAGTIESQFEYVLENSNRWENFKVIKQPWIDKLQNNIADSLNALKSQISENQNILNSHQAETDALNAELEKVNMQLLAIQQEKDSISFLGMFLEKSTYKNMMYALSAGLLAFLLIFIYRFNRSNAITTEIKSTLSEIQEEFSSYKKRALEKEQKLARELQNELNKRIG